MKNCYRIVSDDFRGFEVQIKRWWFPFWVQKHHYPYSVNTFGSLDEAKKWITDGFPKGKSLEERKIFYKSC